MIRAETGRDCGDHRDEAGTAVEDIKRSSNYLRGAISQELDNDVASVSNESEQILKFHGIYAQDNRDVRRERAVKGEELDYIFMIRVGVPGGRLTTDQWLALDAPPPTSPTAR